MENKDIVELLEYQKKLEESKYADRNRNGRADILDLEIPLVEELKDELIVLKEELEKIKKKKISAREYVKKKKSMVDNIKCEHPLMFSHRNLFGTSYSCILCNQSVENRKKQTVSIKKDFYDEDGDFYKRYSFEEIYNILMPILNNLKEDDEIDMANIFTELFNNNIIGEAEINGKAYKKIYKILIVCGCNEISIMKGISLKHEYLDVLEVLNYFHYLYRISTDLIITEDLLENKNWYGLREYKSLEDLYKLLEEVKNVEYGLVIDMTSLFDYEIRNEKINILPVSLDLDKVFPNSLVLKLNDGISKEEMLDILSNKLESSEGYSYDLRKVLLKR